jgi:hypothetical protein
MKNKRVFIFIAFLCTILLILSFISCEFNSKNSTKQTNNEQSGAQNAKAIEIVDTDNYSEALPNDTLIALTLDIFPESNRYFMEEKLKFVEDEFFEKPININLSSSNMIATPDKNLIYYIDNRDIKLFFQNKNDEIVLKDDFFIKGDLTETAELNAIEGVINFDDKIFAVIYTEEDDFMYLFDINDNSTHMEYLYHLYGKNLSNLYDERYYYGIMPAQFDGNVLVYKHDRWSTKPREVFEYNIKNNTFNKLISEYTENERYYRISPNIAYSENYLFIFSYEEKINGLPTTDVLSYNSGKMFIIERKSYNVVGELDLRWISDRMPILFNIDEENMYFFCPDEGTIKAYDLTEDDFFGAEIKTLVRINHESSFVGYDRDENCVILRVNYNFWHGADYYGEDHEHSSENIDDCLLSANKDNAEIVYVSYDLDDMDYKIIHRVKINDTKEPIYCLNRLKDVIGNDYIFTFNYSVNNESFAHYVYSFKFK